MFTEVFNSYLKMHLKIILLNFYLFVNIYGMPLHNCKAQSIPIKFHAQHLCNVSPMNIFSRQGVYVENFDKSRVNVPTFRKGFKAGHEMIFDFKTTSMNGILFHMSRAGRRHDFVALDIVDGHPRYHIRCRHAEATLTLSQVRVDDGKWHTVVFRRRNNRGKLYLDEKPFFHDYRVDCASFTSVTFGGISPEKEFNGIRRALNSYGHFEGCVRSLDVSTGVQDVPQYHGVSACS